MRWFDKEIGFGNSSFLHLRRTWSRHHGIPFFDFSSEKLSILIKVPFLEVKEVHSTLKKHREGFFLGRETWKSLKWAPVTPGTPG
jgi:hypothetical protein